MSKVTATGEELGWKPQQTDTAGQVLSLLAVKLFVLKQIKESKLLQTMPL